MQGLQESEECSFVNINKVCLKSSFMCIDTYDNTLRIGRIKAKYWSYLENSLLKTTAHKSLFGSNKQKEEKHI